MIDATADVITLNEGEFIISVDSDERAQFVGPLTEDEMRAIWLELTNWFAAEDNDD